MKYMRSINCLKIGEVIKIDEERELVVKSAKGLERPCRDCFFLKSNYPCPRVATTGDNGYNVAWSACAPECREDGERVFFSSKYVSEELC